MTNKTRHTENHIMNSPPLFDADTHNTFRTLIDESVEALQLAKASPDLDDLAATIAVAFLKLGMATGLAEQKHAGFAKDVEAKRQHIINVLTAEQQKNKLN